MMSFFYSPAAAARSRRGRDKDHPHRRASSASTSGRRAKDLVKSNETRSPTPRSPQATSVPPNLLSDRPRSLVVPTDAEGSGSISAIQARTDLGSESARPDDLRLTKTEKASCDAPATLHLSQQYRTPASLQPYLEDDISEQDEGLQKTVVNDEITETNFDNTASDAEAPSANSAVDAVHALEPRLLEHRKASHLVPGAVPNYDTEEHRHDPLASGQSLKRTEATVRNKEPRQQHPSPREDAAKPRVQSVRADGAETHTEMQERRRSRLSQTLVPREEAETAEASSIFARTFTPPSGPLGAAPSGHSPLFMSPVPMRATYPPAHDQYAGLGGVPSYQPNYYYPYPSGPSERLSGQFPHIPYYMDQMIQDSGPTAFHHPHDPASSMHTDNGRGFGPEEDEAAQPPFDSAHALLIRVENALPDLHQLVQQYRETSSQANVQLATFRQADAEKNALLQEKDHYIHHLLAELEQHSHRHVHERKSLEKQLLYVEKECKRLRDESLLNRDAGQYYSEVAEKLPLQKPSPREGNKANCGAAQHESGISQEEKKRTVNSKGPQEAVPTSRKSSVDKAKKSPVMLFQEPAELQAKDEEATKPHETRFPENNPLTPSTDQAPATGRERSPVTMTKKVLPASKVDSQVRNLWKEVMPGAFDLADGEKIETQEASDEDIGLQAPDLPDGLPAENARLRNDLDKLKAQWEMDKMQLMETNRKLECAATKLGIENLDLHKTIEAFGASIELRSRGDDFLSDQLFKGISQSLSQESAEKEALWRQQITYAAYTAPNAQQCVNKIAASIVEEIWGMMDSLMHVEEVPGLISIIRGIVKAAAETWRYARLEKDTIIATVDFKQNPTHFDGMSPADQSSQSTTLCLFPCILKETQLPLPDLSRSSMYQMYSRGEQAFIPVAV